MHKQDTHYNNIYYHNFKKPILEAQKTSFLQASRSHFLGFKKQLLEILEANLGSQVLSQEAASQTGFSKMSFLESQGCRSHPLLLRSGKGCRIVRVHARVIELRRQGKVWEGVFPMTHWYGLKPLVHDSWLILGGTWMQASSKPLFVTLLMSSM